MNLVDDPSGVGMEVAQLIAASAEWQHVKTGLLTSLSPTMGPDEVLQAVALALAEVGLDGETILASVPEAYAPLITEENRGSLAKALDQYMAASVLTDMQSGAPLPLISLARGGVRVETHEMDGASFTVVHALVTPLDDPEIVIEQLREACYRTYDKPQFAQRKTNVRDAEWWRRHAQGDPFRDIALSDPRSGLVPEAAMAPVEYADEVLRATDRVRRAVRRFKARWTRKADSMSKEAH